jgi:hypothetical protein
LGGEREGKQQGVGSQSPTEDECGWTFAPRSPKRGFLSKLKGQFISREVGRKGKGWIVEQYS